LVELRDRQRAWLKQALAQSGLSGTALAKKADLSQSTLTRFLSDPEHGSALSARTMAAIELATGVKFGERAMPGGVSEAEAAPYGGTPNDGGLSVMVERVVNDRVGVDPWRFNSRALETAGFFPGDILIVDLNAAPRPGDVVCAQHYSWRNLSAATIFRVFEPPLLLAKTYDSSVSPLLPLDDDVTVKGVVIASIRPRQGRD
jgi:transcriptional regulator with XRE-family HTH domain